MAYLEIKDVHLGFGTPDNRTEVLSGVNLSVEENEFVAVVGFSGSGKSTLIALLAGLLQPDSGEVTVAGQPVKEPSPRLGIMFQNYSLLPWLSVYENVELAVQQVFRKSMNKAERKEWILHNLKLVNMDHALDKRPGEISGGMAQRVGIARALAMKPSVLLMDEPFGALDALTRAHLQDSLMKIQQDLNSTVIMITHDVDEAVLLSDRIVMMTNGPAATIGEELHIELERPRNRVTLADHPGNAQGHSKAGKNHRNR